MSNPGADSIAFFHSRYNIDSAAMSSLLSIALSRGGDFAELFFEHRTNSAIQWEDQRVKSASRNVAQDSISHRRQRRAASARRCHPAPFRRLLLLDR